MRALIVLLAIISLGTVQAQNATFSVTVSNDSILAGNQLVVTFSLENAQGEDFYFPDFNNGLRKVGGPNVSSQMSFINGQSSQSVSYTFYVQADEVGDFYVEPASVKVNGNYLETAPLLVRVHPNPDGIIQSPQQQASPFDGNPFGDSPFSDDFWNNDFFNQEPSENGFFRNFFFDSPFENLSPIPLDSLLQQQIPQGESKPKKRKTTRI